jgi:sulfate transport system permease protein
MGLLYGIILCNARAMGEFGAVSVVSGHIRNQTCTMPLQIEILHSEYQFAHAFALASILSLLGIITLMLKVYLEGQTTQRLPAEVPERRRHRDPATPNP